MSNLVITIKADELIAVIEKLVEVLDGRQIERLQGPAVVTSEYELENEKPQAEPSKTVAITIEQIRAVLAEKSQSGKQPEVKALITKFGAPKLTAIDPACYAEMLKEAEAL